MAGLVCFLIWSVGMLCIGCWGLGHSSGWRCGFNAGWDRGWRWGVKKVIEQAEAQGIRVDVVYEDKPVARPN